jgi:hypothetical protein
LYLEIVKKKQTSKEIAAALIKGGMESTSKKFPAITHAILDRACKANNPALVKLGTQWGLASWYPNLVPSASAKSGTKKSAKKASKKATPPAAPKKETPRRPAQPVSVAGRKSKPVSASTKRVTDIIHAKPGNEFALDDIAKATGMEVNKVNLVIGNLLRGGKVEKTSGGKYRAVA